eukprot:626255-Rhodomonas_salina.1
MNILVPGVNTGYPGTRVPGVPGSARGSPGTWVVLVLVVSGTRSTVTRRKLEGIVPPLVPARFLSEPGEPGAVFKGPSITC